MKYFLGCLKYQEVGEILIYNRLIIASNKERADIAIRDEFKIQKPQGSIICVIINEAIIAD